MDTPKLHDAIILFDYEAVEETELSVKKGEIAEIVDKNEDDWCLARIGDRIGWIPFDYTQIVDPAAIMSVPDTGASTAASSSSSGADNAAVDDATKALEQLNTVLNNETGAAGAKGAAGAVSASADLCAGCNEAITSRYVVAKDKKFHVEHFSCNVCAMHLAGQPFIDKDDAFFCENCYYAKFNPPCGYCSEVIRGNYITALGQSWHPDHFVCTECSQPFTGTQFRKHDNLPYCEDHYNKLFGTACSKCGQNIDGQVFEALGKKFHKDCFVCETGGHAMNVDTTFHIYEDKVYCSDHFGALFSQTCTACGKIIDGQYVKVHSDHFHPECWTCAECKSPIDQSNAQQYAGKFVCTDCRFKLGAAANAAAAKVAATLEAEKSKDAAASGGSSAAAASDVSAAKSDTSESKLPVAPSKVAPKKGDETKDQAGQEYYPLSMLAVPRDKCPPGVVYTQREKFLAPDVFEKLFKMNREEFDKLRDWKKKKLKQSLGLF